MKSSFRLLQVAGIDIKIHFTFPLILALGAMQWASPWGVPGAVFGVVLMLALFVCVALHELGHSLVAQRFGVPVREIVLLPIGGVAMLGRNPRRPLHELLIAAAGPLVNVLIAAGLAVALEWHGRLPLDGDALLRVGDSGPSLSTLAQWLLMANVSLVVFNLLPAFPMDGGRMLRAVLAMALGFRRATRIATAVGQILALGLGLWALFQGHLLLALLAAFVFLGAGQERATEEARTLLSSLRLGDAYNKHALVLQPGDRVNRVVDYLLTSYQPDFAVVHGGRLLGVVTRDAVLAALLAAEPDSYVTGIMDRNVLHLEAGLSLAEARERMAEQEARVAAVFDESRGETHFLGLVNMDDLHEALRIAAFVHLGEARHRPGPAQAA
jgi:Zn-dependent protease